MNITMTLWILLEIITFVYWFKVQNNELLFNITWIWILILTFGGLIVNNRADEDDSYNMYISNFIPWLFSEHKCQLCNQSLIFENKTRHYRVCRNCYEKEIKVKVST